LATTVPTSLHWFLNEVHVNNAMLVCGEVKTPNFNCEALHFTFTFRAGESLPMWDWDESLHRLTLKE
jgi:hypothetical protein